MNFFNVFSHNEGEKHERRTRSRDLMNNMTRRADYKYNHFHRLPEELIVSIFNNIADLKCLFYCSLVSKHFASVISHVRTVSVTITGRATYDREHMERITNFCKEFMGSDSGQLHDVLDLFSLQRMKLPVFLDKLTELESIDLNYDYPEKNTESPSPMSKIKFCSDGVKIESFVVLEPRYMHKATENEPDEEEDIEYKSAAICRAMGSWSQFSVRYLEWVCFMAILIKCHSTLRRVTITDPEVNGKLVIGGEQLVIGDEQCADEKFMVLAELLEQCSGQIVSRIGWFPVLHLPLSGYVMRWVAVSIIDLPENSCTRAKKLDEIEFWDLDDELPVFREAMKEIFKKHQDRFRVFDL